MNRNHQLSAEKASEYWSKVPATVDGVLGGFGFISDLDIDGSRIFLTSLMRSSAAPATTRALDCGAGIGRITKYLLIPNFERIDVVEPNEKFIENIKVHIGEESYKVETLYKCCLQDFHPEKEYDLIWIQWVLGHLEDQELVDFLLRCRNAIRKGGLVVIKENVTSSMKVELDNTDSSITRPLQDFLDIFKKSKLKRIKQCRQTNFPEGIYPVYMFALQPSDKELSSKVAISLDAQAQ